MKKLLLLTKVVHHGLNHALIVQFDCKDISQVYSRNFRMNNRSIYFYIEITEV